MTLSSHQRAFRKEFRDGVKFLSKDRMLGPHLTDGEKLLFDLPAKLDVFAALTRWIVEQQLSVKAARAIHQRVKDLLPKRFDAPSFLKLEEHLLRQAGLSRGKIRSLRDLAHHVHTKKLPRDLDWTVLSDDDVTKHLTQVHGIGPWTAHMMLIFQLGRLDVFPSGDLAIQKGFQRVFKSRTRPSPVYLDRIAKQWKPYRSIAALALWNAVDPNYQL